MPAYAVNSMLDLIGGTPLVRLRHLVEPGRNEALRPQNEAPVIAEFDRHADNST